MNRRIDISHKTVFFITAFLVLLWVLYQIREVIILLFVALILMAALVPLVNRLERWKFPRALAIGVVYVLVIGCIAALVTLVVVPLSNQSANLASSLPAAINQLFPFDVNRELIQAQLGDITKNVLSVSLVIFNNIVAVVSVAVITFYLILERAQLEKYVLHFFINHPERQKRINAVIDEVEEKLGAWVRGQLVLSLSVGVLVYIFLEALSLFVPHSTSYAIPLAILAGLLEIVPTIGPIISAIPAVILAYTVSPALALVVVAGYFVIQQVENHFLVPQIMKRAVGLNPLLVILAVAAGGKLGGFAGVLLAVPIVVMIQVIVQAVIKEN